MQVRQIGRLAHVTTNAQLLPGLRLRAARTATDGLLAATAGLALALLGGAWFVFPIHVTSNSMAPYLRAGDYGVAMYGRHLGRGDVIVFRLPFGSGELAIKRAVALGGDCVPATRHGSAVSSHGSCPAVPEGAVYVIGDDNGNSLDSRHFGAVPASEIVGKVVLRLPVTRWLPRQKR